jgi:hypothetical protein
MFEYEIGGRKFVQKALVLGQVKLLITTIKGVTLPRDATPASLVIALGDKVSDVLAIVLSEEGIPLKNKKLRDVQDLIEEHLSIEQSIGMVEDFFDCNPIASISEAMIGLAKKVEQVMTAKVSKEPSTESASPLVEETLPSETISSGALQ